MDYKFFTVSPYVKRNRSVILLTCFLCYSCLLKYLNELSPLLPLIYVLDSIDGVFLFLLLNVQYIQIRINHQFNHLYTDPVIAQLVERETVVE